MILGWRGHRPPQAVRNEIARSEKLILRVGAWIDIMTDDGWIVRTRMMSPFLFDVEPHAEVLIIFHPWIRSKPMTANGNWIYEAKRIRAINRWDLRREEVCRNGNLPKILARNPEIKKI